MCLGVRHCLLRLSELVRMLFPVGTAVLGKVPSVCVWGGGGDGGAGRGRGVAEIVGEGRRLVSLISCRVVLRLGASVPPQTRVPQGPG